MKLVPIGLQKLELNIEENNIGENVESLKWFGEGLKQLPSNLQDLRLGLSENILGGNTENCK